MNHESPTEDSSEVRAERPTDKNQSQSVKNISVKNYKKSKELAKYLDIKVPQIATTPKQIKTFREWFYFEFRNRVKNILDYYKVLGALRLDYINFGNSLVHDAFVIYINNRVIGTEIMLQETVEQKIGVWKAKYGAEDEVLRAIAGELFEMIKNLKILKWKFMDYCKKQGLVAQADVIALKEVEQQSEGNASESEQ
jgi:hypothetical protein